MTLKHDRSNRFTQGIVCTLKDSKSRFCFFEIDLADQHYGDAVLAQYRLFKLDVLWHRTGNGRHFLSPTCVSKEIWKAFMEPLKHINPKCPMTTLRIKPNKYPNEEQIWYNYAYFTNRNLSRNSQEMCRLLNRLFHTSFLGNVQTELKFVWYPLPK